jgi:hypothetical protein
MGSNPLMCASCGIWHEWVSRKIAKKEIIGTLSPRYKDNSKLNGKQVD